VKRFLSSIILIPFLFVQNAFATLNIEITQGIAGAAPIGVMAIHNVQSAQNFAELAQVIRNDLRNSGRFKPLYTEQLPQVKNMQQALDVNVWRKYDIENTVVGEVVQTGTDSYNVNVKLLDLYQNVASDENSLQKGELVVKNKKSAELISKTYSNISAKDFRSLAHHISDTIFERLTGIRGAFSTRIAYIMVLPTAYGTRYQLEVADMDGFNPRTLLSSKEPIMSPSWSPDGKFVSFVSFEHKRSGVYVMEVSSGKRELLSRHPGINGAPCWSPDGRKIALVLSKDGSPKIYTIELKNKELKQVTKGYSIDTEPTFSPNGKDIYFTSNRGGKPQIYKVDIASSQVKRVTFQGDYNARPMITADGKRMVMMHRSKPRVFHIASLDLYNGEFNLLTRSESDESPTLSPNGAMVLYGTQSGSRRVLGLVTIDGLAKLRLPAREGSVQEPAWSPFLS
jgi:TolB protein